MRDLLKHPALYQIYQTFGGFFSARISAIHEYLEIKPTHRIIDIGCGPGYIVRHLPTSVDYIGLDIDDLSINHANDRFGQLGKFYCRLFDADAVKEFGPVDIVMMNGVMHHISDSDLIEMFRHVRNVLTKDGVLFTLDGCYSPGQSRMAKWLLDNDRGVHVRNEAGYRALLRQAFDRVELHIRDDYSRLPYTFAIGVAHKND